MSKSIKEKLSSLLNKASDAALQLGETVKEQAEKGKDFVEDKIKERECNDIYRKLGKKVYKLVQRDEVELPESCDKYILALDELLDYEDELDEDAEDSHLESESATSSYDAQAQGDEKEEVVFEALLIEEEELEEKPKRSAKKSKTEDKSEVKVEKKSKKAEVESEDKEKKEKKAENKKKSPKPKDE